MRGHPSSSDPDKALRGLSSSDTDGGRRSPAVACWASDLWVDSSNPLGGKFRH